MNVFTSDLGIHQGRIAAANAPEGTFVYELGHSLLAAIGVNVGDFHEVSQNFVLTETAKFVKAAIYVTVPPILPIQGRWEVSGWLNSTKVVSRYLRVSKRRIRLDDWRISLAHANAAPMSNLLRFRLELVA